MTPELPDDRMPNITWDMWGVPHIRAEDEFSAAYAVGWAQCRAHAGLILELIGVARGRGAEYWGASFRDEDIVAWSMRLPDLGASWWQRQGRDARARVEAYCAGVNDWCDRHPDRARHRREALPVTPQDIMAHGARQLFHFARLIGDRSSGAFPAENFPAPGSNAWVVAASRSVTGNALMLANPHLPWSGRYLLFELHITYPGRDLYGVTFPGFPCIIMGFTPELGWSHTVNPVDIFSVYKLDLEGDGYQFAGEFRALDCTDHTLAVRDGNALREERLRLRRSVHGPVIEAPDGATIAVRIAGIHEDTAWNLFQTWWNLSSATTIVEAEQVLESGRLPMFNTLVAASDGNIAAFYCGRPPVRSEGSFADWARRLPGGDPAWLWTSTHTQTDLPRLTNPASGFLQNSNDPPWTYTDPPLLRSRDFPNAIAPAEIFPGFRAVAAVRPFEGGTSVLLEDLVRHQQSARVGLASAVLPALISAASDSDDALVAHGVDVLARWDMSGARDSRGAVLFHVWAKSLESAIGTGALFAHAWRSDASFQAPSGLADPPAAVAALRRACETLERDGHPLDIAWGDVARMAVGDDDLPAAGFDSAFGALKALRVLPRENGGLVAVFGDTFICAIEFGAPRRASGILVYGNATEADLPGRRAQMELASRGELRPILLDEADIRNHSFDREHLSSMR